MATAYECANLVMNEVKKVVTGKDDRIKKASTAMAGIFIGGKREGIFSLLLSLRHFCIDLFVQLPVRNFFRFRFCFSMFSVLQRYS